MADFKRGFSKIDQLKKEPLFQKKLLPDITNGGIEAVFPALRDEYVSFYYKGGGLFKYDGKFSTHYKYAFVPENKEKIYVDETNVANMKPISSFSKGYGEIKDRCKQYGTTEAEGVSVLYQKNATVADKIILLDTEVAFSPENLDEDDSADKKQQRIDLLLFDKGSKTLLFVEAKHFSNKELWSQENTPPKVVDQIARYEKVIADQEKNIRDEYIKYVEQWRELFDLTKDQLPNPEHVHPKTGLLIFGYDLNQRAKIEQKLIKDGSLAETKYYINGGFNSVHIEKLYDAITKGD